MDNGDQSIMQNDIENACIRRARFPRCLLPPGRSGRGAILALAAMVFFLQSACLFKGKKEAVMPSAPVRVAFIPFNTPEGSTQLRWASLAMPILLAKISERAEGMETVPLWESVRYAIESTGNSRTVTQESAAYVANWMNSKWCVMGTLSQAKNDKITLLMDFIPSREDDIPFRFIKTMKMDEVDYSVQKAFQEFLHYVSAKPLETQKGKTTNLASLRQLAEALDREYGWSVPAERGQADEIVSNLFQSDPQLARSLFNPNTYSILKDE